MRARRAREIRRREDLRQVVDEGLAAKRGDAGDLGFLGQFEEHIGRIDLPATRADQAPLDQKAARRRMQVVSSDRGSDAASCG